MSMQASMYKVGNIGAGFFAMMAQPSPEPVAAASISNIARLRIQLVVSLLEASEARSLGLEHERDQVRTQGMSYLSYPIPDMGLPPSVEEFGRMTRVLYKQISAGSNTLIHCRAGIGRSGLLAAGILLHCQLEPEQAFQHVSKMRGIRVPETWEQENWLVMNQKTILDSQDSSQ